MGTKNQQGAADERQYPRRFSSVGRGLGLVTLIGVIVAYLILGDRLLGDGESPVQAEEPVAGDVPSGESPAEVDGIPSERVTVEGDAVEPEIESRPEAKTEFEETTDLEVSVIEVLPKGLIRPLEGCFVRVQSNLRGGSRAYWNERTDAEGIVLVEGIPIGETRVEAAGDLGQSVTVEPGVLNRTVFRRVGGVAVQGIVVDAEGARVGGAQIRTSDRSNGGDRSLPLTEANDEGEFRVEGISPMLYLGAQHPEYRASELVQIPMAGDQVIPIQLKLLAPGRPLTVHVQAPEGQPIAGAVVSAGLWNTIDRIRRLDNLPPLVSPAVGWTGADGRCELLGIWITPGLALTVKHREFGTESLRVDTEENSEVTVTLRGLSRVSGRVLDLDGNPVPSAQVSCIPRPDGGHSRSDSRSVFAMAMTRTMSDGQYVIENAPAGKVGVVVRSDELGALDETIEVVPGEDSEIEFRYPELLIQESHLLVGTVETPSGAPGADLYVRVSSLASKHSEGARTDREGRFEIARCPSGEVSVRVDDSRTRPRMPVLVLPSVVLGDSVTWRIEEELARGSLRVQLGGAKPGTPLELQLKRFERTTRFDVIVSSRSDVLLEHLVPGQYDVGIAGQDTTEPAVVPSGEIGVVDLEVP